MVRVPLVLFLFAAILLNACSNSKSIPKVVSGLSNTFHGLLFDEAYIMGTDSALLLTNKVPLNSQITIVMNGVRNFTAKDGKVLPGVSLSVIIGNQTVIQKEDLFASSSGISPEEASSFSGTVKLGPPVMAGQTYRIKMRVWDKNKTENELITEVDLEVE